jgi:hypothetical protein
VPAWRDRAVIGLRWLLLLLFCAGLYLWRVQNDVPNLLEGLILAAVVGGVANLLATLLAAANAARAL